MMRIGIDLNGVLRNTIGKFEQLYEKHMIDSENDLSMGNVYQLDISGNTELIENSVEAFEYKKISEVTSTELDEHFSFRDKEELFNFMYEEYAMEIFGHAPSTEMTTFNVFNDFYFDFRNQNEILIISKEIGKSKPSSLFFLSKFGCLVEKIFFFSDLTKHLMWDQVDILLTADPSLLLEKPENKVLIKFNTTYNQNVMCDYEIDSLSELSELINHKIQIENV